MHKCNTHSIILYGLKNVGCNNINVQKLGQITEKA